MNMETFETEIGLVDRRLKVSKATSKRGFFIYGVKENDFSFSATQEVLRKYQAN